MSKAAYIDKLIRAQEWLYDELKSYMYAEKINGAPLDEEQRNAYSAIKTAFECVVRVTDEMRLEVE